jgi:cardiolipin synthase
VQVGVLVDGFGCNGHLPVLRQRLAARGVPFEVFRPLDRWRAWLQPSQLRRLHQKLCVVDAEIAFVGGINVIDDRFDVQHGWAARPRLDFAVRIEGALAADVQHLVQALWTRARLGRDWREEVALLARSDEPVQQMKQLASDLRTTPVRERVGVPARAWRWLRGGAAPQVLLDRVALAALPPVQAALVVRDNVLQRRAIERAYVQAIGQARQHIDIACAYFYPGRAFRRALRRAAARGVQVRLLMQGKLDYRVAGLAARVLYAEMLSRGIRVFEYTPAFLHAKVAVIDGRWATVGSSNIDPLSLWLNLEANVVVVDEGFARALAHRLEQAFAESVEVTSAPLRAGWRAWLGRGLVTSLASIYLRLAGVNARRY